MISSVIPNNNETLPVEHRVLLLKDFCRAGECAGNFCSINQQLMILLEALCVEGLQI